MVRTTKSAKVLVGAFCLPTSARAHVHEPRRCTAYAEGQEYFVLTATQSVDDGGYPPQVVLSALPDQLEWQLGEEVATQHAQVRKNLPPRRVTGILRADGSVEGELPARGLGLPHWEFIPANEDGSASTAAITACERRIVANKAEAEAAKAELRASKKAAKSA